MKYAIGVNICPTKTSGLCNQLYRILAAIQFASNNNIPIVCIDKFYKQINSDVFSNERMLRSFFEMTGKK